jgi:predicted alpha/beta-fold hydrolase
VLDASIQTPIFALRNQLQTRTFTPHRVWRSGHAQTIIGYLTPRRSRLRRLHADDETRLFQVEADVQMLAHCRWQESRTEHPTLVLLHGLEGSSESVYMLGTADKAFQNGFNTVRVNMRNCGGTEHLTPTLYHSGLSSDMLAITRELIAQDCLQHIYLCGFSMGGNIVLKFAGEMGADTPAELQAVCAVSPSLDLRACALAIEHPSNRIYQRRFVRSLHRRLRQKAALFPNRYDTGDLARVRTVREFDEAYTAPHAGFRDADDYYAQSSALPLLANTRRPVLIVHAQDDPFVPFESFKHPNVSDNPNVVLLAPSGGGHVGFVAARDPHNPEDRFWAENRVVEFCRAIDEHRTALTEDS